MKEAFPISFPGYDKIREKADRINEKVDTYFERPRTNKAKSADEVVDEIVKKESTRINLLNLPEEERKWYENMQTAGIRILKDGFLEISRWDNTGKHFNRPVLIKQKVDDINSAIRMQDHVLEKYRSDEKDKTSHFSQIESIQEVIEYANEILNAWNYAKPEEKEEMQIQLANVILQLENCRNEFMVVTRDQATAVFDRKDSLGRENPGALAARTVAALNNLTKRINEMQLIVPFIALRKESLILEKRRLNGTRHKSVAHLQGVLHHAVFKDNPKKPPASRINANEVVELDRKIGKALYFLGSIHAAPYFQQAEQAKFYINNGSKKYFTSKNNLINNLPSIQEGIKEAIRILEPDMEQFG